MTEAQFHDLLRRMYTTPPEVMAARHYMVAHDWNLRPPSR